MENNSFFSNSAVNNSDKEGNGGAIYYTCTTKNKCRVVMRGNHTFINNSAGNSGGGIYWN